MIVNTVQSVGIVFLMILVVMTTIITVYFSYILGIGILVIGLLFVVYQLIATAKSS